MKFALLIPTKNRSDSLNRTLVLARRSVERVGGDIIICDQSAQPIEHAYARVLHRPDLRGLPAARNALLLVTDADLVCFIDDDTDLSEDFCARVLSHAMQERDVTGWGPVVETRPISIRRLHRLAHLGAFHDERRLLGRNCDRPTRLLFGCCFAVRREAALAVGFDERRTGYALGEDADFFLRLSQRGHRLRFCADLHAVHRRDGSDRFDPTERGRRKAEFLLWMARRHGARNPATLLHLLMASAAAAAGTGLEPAGWRGVLRGLQAQL
jgi:GT2 family glycosyltransferase